MNIWSARLKGEKRIALLNLGAFAQGSFFIYLLFPILKQCRENGTSAQKLKLNSEAALQRKPTL